MSRGGFGVPPAVSESLQEQRSTARLETLTHVSNERLRRSMSSTDTDSNDDDIVLKKNLPKVCPW